MKIKSRRKRKKIGQKNSFLKIAKALARMRKVFLELAKK